MTANTAALEFLAARRSASPKLMSAPAPDRAQLTELLALASRVPDHGMLVPWRFIVLTEAALRRLGGDIRATGARLGVDPAALEKACAVYATSPLAVAVIASPKGSEKIPAIEQQLAVGGVCLSLVNAALASGWAAGWVTGWAAHEAEYLPRLLDLSAGEYIAGLVHIGTAAAPSERPRPDVTALTSWLEA